MLLIWPTNIDDSFSQATWYLLLFMCIDEFILQVPDNLKSWEGFMTYSMVFQSPHGFMSLDIDVAYFNFTFIKSL